MVDNDDVLQQLVIGREARRRPGDPPLEIAYDESGGRLWHWIALRAGQALDPDDEYGMSVEYQLASFLQLGEGTINAIKGIEDAQKRAHEVDRCLDDRFGPVTCPPASERAYTERELAALLQLDRGQAQALAIHLRNGRLIVTPNE